MDETKTAEEKLTTWRVPLWIVSVILFALLREPIADWAYRVFVSVPPGGARNTDDVDVLGTLFASVFQTLATFLPLAPALAFEVKLRLVGAGTPSAGTWRGREGPARRKQPESTSRAQPSSPIKPVPVTPSSQESQEEETEIPASQSVDNAFYSIVAKELAEKTIDEGMWLRARIESEGDEPKTELAYARFRIQQLTDEAEALAQAQRAEEEATRSAEKLKLENERWLRQKREEEAEALAQAQRAEEEATRSAERLKLENERWLRRKRERARRRRRGL